MGKYACDFCDYFTHRKNDYRKHIQTKKHARMVTEGNIKVTNADTALPAVTQMLPKVTRKLPCFSGLKEIQPEVVPIHQCDGCGQTYKYRSGLSRHRKRCKRQHGTDKDRVIKELRDQVKEYRALLESSMDIAKTTTQAINTTAETAKTVTKKSYSAINYLMKYHSNAPVIKPLGHREIKLLAMQEEDLLETLEYHQRKKTLHKFIGDFIVTVYKEEDVKLQSVWVSDSSRLTYFVRQLLNDEPRWVVDKTGRILLTTVIQPFLAHLRKHINKGQEEPVKADYPSRSSYYKAIRIYGDAVVLAGELTESNLADRVVRYIAPLLILDKDD